MERTTEANMCDINQLDGGVLLPPRKRLLAGFKKQGYDGNDGALLPSSFASPSSSSSAASSEVEAHLNNLLTCHWNDSNLTPQEIAEASRSAASIAVKAAKAARAAAEEKAAIVAKAVVEAKSALELVASFPDQAAAQERYLKKNKLKHVPIELLYSKHQYRENDGTEEELAPNLLRAVNGSGRTPKTSSGPDRKGYKHKKPKNSPASEKSGILDGGIVLGENAHSMFKGYPVSGKVVSDTSDGEMDTTKPDETKVGHLELDKPKTELMHPKEKTRENIIPTARKRGRPKLKGMS